MSQDKDFVEEPKPSAPQKAAPTAAAKPSQADPEALLTEAEIEDIRAKARAEIMGDKRTKLKAEILAAEKQRLKNEEGLTTGNGHQDEIVSITIDLAPFAPHVNINGKCYYHGRTYPVPRHVADTLRDQMFMTWKHQNQIDGKDLNQFYAAKHIAEMFKVEGGAKLSGKAA
jgi:hypothetical protein